MGTKYTINWYIGNHVVDYARTDGLLSALYYLWFYKPKADFAWKSLEIR